MAASGLGIAAQLPYLQQLIYQYNRRKAQTRRIHMVWQLKTIGKFQKLAETIKEMLNHALEDDTLDDGYILTISIYIEHIPNGVSISPRATIFKGSPDWDKIIWEEAAGKY
ncbi:hypothetical protein CEP54_016127 [Fusarium duplospermum]|uniref:Ferric reductase NAD binding domain-containing protein n=1 Tax=Fusarium duplospermum TaxID=1325734 RepID=A0A428NI29_9HYPO|nr:hypothetical protein CEP54_016127 [Fusarium duplospermum]